MVSRTPMKHHLALCAVVDAAEHVCKQFDDAILTKEQRRALQKLWEVAQHGNRSIEDSKE